MGPTQNLCRVMAVALLSTVLGFEMISAEATNAPVEVRVGVAPIPVNANGQIRLAYELHVTNFYKDTGDLRLERVEVFADKSGLLASYQSAELERLVVQPGSSATDPQVIPGGMRAVIYLWVTLPVGTPTPRSLRHRLTFRPEKGAEETVDGIRVDVHNVSPVILGSPFREGMWLAHEGPGNPKTHHWGSQLALNGRVTIPQRFAVDFIGLDATGAAVHGDVLKSANNDWVGYGMEVLAVADGVVRGMQDGVPDNKPLAPLPPVEAPTARAVGGNYLLLDLGQQRFAFYAHLQPNSLMVRVGDRVRRGQVVGRLGNSGNSNAPHLHLHVSDALSFEESEGLPFVFESFDAVGQTTAARAIGVEPGSRAPIFAPNRRRRELPLDGTVLRFP